MILKLLILILLLDYQTICQSCCTQLIITTALIACITKVWVRKRKRSNMLAFGRFLSDLDWNVLSQLPDCQKICDLFYYINLTGVEFFPQKAVKLHCMETKHGLLLKSNFLSLIDKRLLLFEIQLNIINCEIK